jgi:hypothetical protein
MSTNRAKDRASLCSFSFTDSRRCRTPRRNGHPHLCAFHARKEAQALVVNFAFELPGVAPHVGFYVWAFDFDCPFCFVCQFTNPFGIRTSRNTPVNSLE